MITNKVYNEDCLEALKRVPDKSVDCIITDPPYFLGMTHNGQKGSFKDLSICKPFYRDLFLEFNRVKKTGACVYFFTDWRGYAFYYPLFDLYLGASNMIVWNKQSVPGNHYAFIHELILFHCGKGVSIGATNIIDNIRSFASGAKLVEGEKVHPTQKPVALIRKLIEDSTKPGDLILDTFGGSGTTAVAAIESGRNFVLMEQDEIYYFTAQKRIKDAYNDLTVVDSIYLDAQQKEDVRRLSSLGYSPKDIAVSLGLSLEDAGLFVRDAETVGTSVNFLIREGILVARAAPEIKLHEAAEGGNVEAIKQLEAVRKRHTFERLIEQMDDDEFN